MKRRKAREYALQILFQADFAGGASDFTVPDGYRSEKELDPELRKFAEELARGTLNRLSEIDEIIAGAAANWDLERMAAVDRNILRFATYEIVFRNDIPPAVTINEALEIAKKFSALESVPFINGLLDKIAKDRSSDGREA